jgi:hypothetical protein
MLSALKAVWRAVVPKPVREKVTSVRQRALVRLNHALMRRGLSGAWPHTLYIEGTNICNARCAFCAYPQMQRPFATMPVDLFKRAVSQYLELGPGEIDLTPIVGDPFVDKFLFERLDWLAQHPKVKRFHFYTNAILMKPEYIPRLLAYGERFMLCCSFGGFDQKTYATVMGVDKFEEAAANIRAVIDAKAAGSSSMRIQISLRLPPGNAQGEFWDYLCTMRERGMITIESVADFDNWGGAITDDALKTAGLVPKPPPVHTGACRRLFTGPTVLADGRVNGCCCRDVEATLIIGDVNKQDLADILAGEPLKALIERHERGDFPEICKLCTRYESVRSKWGEADVQ